MPTPNFTLAHLVPLRAHIVAGQPTRLLHQYEPTTDLERDCVEWGLIDVRGWVTTITPAGLALVQAVDATLALCPAAP